jgi:hypothetical protein
MKPHDRWIARLPVALCLAALGAPAIADWVQHPNPLVIPVTPKNLVSQVANPPVFTWPRHASNPPAYVIEISLGTTLYKSFTVTRNWLFPTEKLPGGSYNWRVRPSTSTTEWSDRRNFTIDSTAREFVVPDDATLRTQITAKPRPRSIQASMPVYAEWSAALKAERGISLTRLRTEVDWQAARIALPLDSNWLLSTATVTAATVAQTAAVRQSIYANGRQLNAAALLYRLTGEQKYLDEALRRADAFANLSATGPTSYLNQDQGTRIIALGLAKTVDLLIGALDATRRARYLAIIDVRMTDMYNDLAGNNGRMDQYPFDSHGGTNLAYLALVAALTVGDIPHANTWFDFAFRASVASTSHWSGPDGGFANGTAYAQYTAEILQSIWQPLGIITDVNMFDKPWSRGFMHYLMQFLPPGSTRHVFGDEHEVTPMMKVPKGFMSRYATPQAAWYFRTVADEMDTLMMLEAPYPMPVSSITTVAPPANAALFAGIGWTAMHSNIADSNRTSVFFKSSPYGSFNHSHADQNSFVLVKGGKVVLAEAGYSDYFGSPLSESWYRQTRAHNAVTFDGGIGQATGGYTPLGYTKQMVYGGRIMAFSSTTATDYVEGDATATYDGALSTAVRKLWYLRKQDAVVILDSLAAQTARKFEWNLHALAPMVFENNTSTVNVTDASGTQRVCVRPVQGGTDIVLERRTGATPKAGTVEDHAAYVSSAARTSQEFLMLVDVGCTRPTLRLVTGSTGRTLTVGNQFIIIPR